MKTNNSYAVLGLGRYGYAVAKELVDSGAEVLVVDSQEEVINDVVGEFPLCKCADITDEDAIVQLGISNIDVVMEDDMITASFDAKNGKRLNVEHEVEKTSINMETYSTQQIKQMTSYDVEGKVITAGE